MHLCLYFMDNTFLFRHFAEIDYCESGARNNLNVVNIFLVETDERKVVSYRHTRIELIRSNIRIVSHGTEGDYQS